jgi:mRNA-degrading endonuclease toxin of MazEF toxin-antitoxin module
MPSYRFGDVVYAPLGYADDATVADDRPAVVISGNEFNNARSDVILMEITTRLHQARRFGAFEVIDWVKSGLKAQSVIKPLVFSVSQADILQTWGHLDPATEKILRQTIPMIFGFRVSSAASKRPSQ